jgi:hypothetical protein
MDKVEKHNSFNTNTPSSESYKNDNLYSSTNIVRMIISKRMSWVGYVACTEEGRDVYRVLVGRSECKRPLGIPRHRWVNKIKKGLREMGINGANWVLLAQDTVQWGAFVSMVMNLQVP